MTFFDPNPPRNAYLGLIGPPLGPPGGPKLIFMIGLCFFCPNQAKNCHNFAFKTLPGLYRSKTKKSGGGPPPGPPRVKSKNAEIRQPYFYE